MLGLANDHGDHSFLLIDDKYIDSTWTGWLLEERAFLNHPRERGSGHRFELSIVGKSPIAANSRGPVHT